MNIDIETLKIVGAILGPILGIVSTIAPLFFRPSKARLRTDLEILKLLKEDDPNYQKVKNVVNEKIDELYKATKENYGRRIAIGLLGIMFLVGFGYWSYKLVVPEFSWWSLLTTYFSAIGVFYLVMALVGMEKLKAIIPRSSR
jgi:MFS family permease